MNTCTACCSRKWDESDHWCLPKCFCCLCAFERFCRNQDRRVEKREESEKGQRRSREGAEKRQQRKGREGAEKGPL